MLMSDWYSMRSTVDWLFIPLLEPLSGVIEGISASMFLIAMMVGVTALLICRQKARKVLVPGPPCLIYFDLYAAC